MHISNSIWKDHYNRLPYGINSADELFCQQIHKYFGDIPNLLIYMDDFLIIGNGKTHNETLKIVFEKARKVGLKFNLEKCKFNLKEVIFLGPR